MFALYINALQLCNCKALMLNDLQASEGQDLNEVLSFAKKKVLNFGLRVFSLMQPKTRNSKLKTFVSK